MSTAEETIKNTKSDTKSASKPAASKSKLDLIINSVLDLLSSVRFGVSLLVLLVALSMLGMLITQQTVEGPSGFPGYFSGLTPAEKIVGGWFGVFDIYHVWYFNLLLLVLSLNIVLASIDRFPTAWAYIIKPKLEATKAYLMNQRFHHQVQTELDKSAATDKTIAAFKKSGFKARAIEKDNGRTILFAQKNAFNRLGAYIVHVALLTLFLGHFVALQTGYDADVELLPGKTASTIDLVRFTQKGEKERAEVALPFTLYCSDIQQTLVDQKGGIEINNTLDWFTRMTITDPIYGKRNVSVSLNQPYTWRGYRFFQASANTLGSARQMTLQLTPDGGEPFTVNLMRNGAASLPDGTKIEYVGFFPDFALIGGKPDTRSADYNNPAAQIKITAPTGDTKNAFAFAADLPAGAPVGAAVFGYKYKMANFEKSPFAHVLSIKYDPFYGSTIAWYFGGGLLVLSLFAVFFFAHQRLWAIIEPNGTITLGGHANRNETAFEDKFKKLTAELQ